MTDQQGPALPWKERVAMLSINPDAATRDDVASLADELMIANHKVARAEEAERWAEKLAGELVDIARRFQSSFSARDIFRTAECSEKILSEYAAWKKSRE
ncbi:MAG: hypothetical protein E6Q97_06810 [Desulfurellales bacterium]|nr:MAG: hypothetical protein E6Q97_06810 [Desulfurellales bacterium]